MVKRSCYVYGQEAEKGGRQRSAHFLLCIHSGTPVHGIVSTSFRVCLPQSINPIQKCSCIYAWRLSGTLFKLSLTINTHHHTLIFLHHQHQQPISFHHDSDHQLFYLHYYSQHKALDQDYRMQAGEPAHLGLIPASSTMLHVSVFLTLSEGDNSTHLIELDQGLTTQIQRKCTEPRVVSESTFLWTGRFIYDI